MATTINNVIQIVIDIDADFSSGASITIPRAGTIVAISTVATVTGTVDIGTAADPNGIVAALDLTDNAFVAAAALGALGTEALTIAAGAVLQFTTSGSAVRGIVTLTLAAPGASLTETGL